MKVYHYLLLTLLGCLPFIGHAQTTAIPDTAFEAKLVQLGIDSDGLVNGQIPDSAAAAVTNLPLLSSNIRDLTGIEAFVNLTDLDCRFNLLDTLVLTNNLALRNLDFSHNSISSIDLSANTNLDDLRCSSTDLTRLDLSNNTGLRRLYCQATLIDTLDLSNNTALTHFDCFGSKLVHLDLTNNTVLREVVCQSNDLVTLTIPNHPLLEDLNCKNNELTSLDITSCSALQTLECENNRLTTLRCPTNSTSLLYLYCFDNQLDTIYAFGNTNLRNFYCYNNQIRHLDVSNTPNLRYFYAQENRLTTLDVSSSPLLIQLYVQDNPLGALDVTNQALLQNLNIGNTQIATIDLSNNGNLRQLSADEARLSTLDISNKPSLIQVFCSFNSLVYINSSNSPALQILAANHNFLSYINLKNKPNLNSIGMMRNLPNMTICVDDSIAASNNISWFKEPDAVYSEICSNTNLIGYVKNDVNTNCIADASDPAFQQAIISIASATDTIYRRSNTFGFYGAELDTGFHTTSVTLPHPYAAPCVNPQTTIIDSPNDLDTIDWAFQAVQFCPYLTANISAPFLRMTGGGSVYTVNYCNNGTAPAYGAYIEVDIDTFLTVLGASLPILVQQGNTYTFDLDTLDVGECGSFQINVLVDTSAQIGQIHCTEVHIYPDSLCGNTWTGPIISAQGFCQTDTARFEIENTGANMTMPLSYTIFEDDIILMVNPFNLNANSKQDIRIPTQPGKSYRIEAQQAPNFPPLLGPHIAHANVMGCQPGVGNLGIMLNYYNGDPTPWIDIDCQANIAAYDPNDKTPQPLGFGPAHYITNPTPITYKIRFQNTGNDTAFNVIILDTLSPHLDISTLQLKSASHAYNWELVSGNALQMHFPNIKLVDSMTNEPLSHGFFTYEITPKPNLPLQTRIENSAAIYFDYNPPIFTNTTWHTIGENFVPQIVIGTYQVTDQQVAIQAYPNPFDHSTTIVVEGAEQGPLEFVLMDITGRIIKRQPMNGNRLQVYKNDIPTGVYLYQIQSDQKLVGTGKLMVR